MQSGKQFSDVLEQSLASVIKVQAFLSLSRIETSGILTCEKYCHGRF